MPKSVDASDKLSLTGHGTIPVGSLAFAIAGKANSGNQEIPEPALLLGLMGLGVAIVRDRKVAASKRAAAKQATPEPTHPFIF